MEAQRPQRAHEVAAGVARSGSGLPTVDLYQIHGPVSLRSHSAIADALAAAHEAGLVKAVGVSNYSVKETRAIDAELRTRGMRLATNQIEFSLLRRAPETSGLLAACAGARASCRSPTRRSARVA